MRHTPPKTLCWLLVLLLLVEWSGVIGWLPDGQAAQAVSLTLPSTAELAKTGSRTPQIPPRSSVTPDDLVARTEALIRGIPRVRYDVAARAQALGQGVDPAFRFVRDQIRFEGYPGVLRGAEGSYVTRAGNAFDRSLLLADLLRRKGLKTRFAMGTIPRPQAERLFTRIFAPAPPLEADAVSKTGTFGQAEGEAFMTRLRTRAMQDYAAIRKALGNSPPAKASPSREEVLREIEGHVWVQAEVNGRWVDLDSAFPDATAGRTYATAERTLEALSRESYQRVTIRVTSETLASGSLKIETAVEFSAPAEELLDRQVFLTHTPGVGSGGLAGGISGAVAGADAWTPVLWINGQFHIGKPISFSEQAKPVERGRPPGGGLGGLFGAGGALSAPSQFVAEWLEFETAFPDGRREVVRRALIDRAGMAWRLAGKLDAAALRPLSRDAIGITAPRALHNVWFSAGRHNLRHYTWALWQLAQWIKEVRQGRDASRSAGVSSSTPRSFGEQVWPLAVTNFALLVQSDHVVVPALNDSAPFRFYADSPRILVVSTDVDSSAGRYVQYDLRRDRLRGIARDTSAEAGLLERKIWFGVLQGALEHEMAMEHAVAGGADSAKVMSTSALLTDEGAVGLRPTDAARVSGLFTSKDIAARAARALAGGNILVVSKPVFLRGLLAWWQIAPDGETRAVLGEDTNAATWYPGPDGGIIDYPIPKDWVGDTLPRTVPRDPPVGVGGPEPPGTGVWPQEPPLTPGGTKDDCKKGSSLPTQGIRLAMASTPTSGILDGHARESDEPPVLLAQTATESTLVTKCVSVPAVGVAGIAMAIVALGFLGVAAAALGYLIGSNL